MSTLLTHGDSVRLSDLIRDLGVKIRSVTRSLNKARTVYDLLGKEDVLALIKGRQEVWNLAVRRQVLIECWEAATGHVWASGVQG